MKKNCDVILMMYFSWRNFDDNTEMTSHLIFLNLIT